jgi:nucleoside-diphosphate-sugar epimerase
MLVRPLVRAVPSLPTDAETVAVGDIGAETDWSAALAGVDCVIHCAARAHVLKERAVNPLAAFRVVNVVGTRKLAEKAATMGVRRLIFLSSIGVLGVNTNGREPFSIADSPAPRENYGISKWEAEETLWQVAAQTDLEVVVIRPPLVYGPGVRANFLRLLQLVKCGLPLPLGAVDNLRSLVSLDNLVDLLIRCVDHPSAAGHTFLVSDDHDISTPELIFNLADLMGRKARLLPVPPRMLRLGGRLLGRLPEIERLIGSLQVNILHTRERLNWTPPMSVEEGLYRTVRAFLGSF